MNACALRAVGDVPFGVGDPDDLVAAVAVEVGDRGRRCGPLQPGLAGRARPGAGVQVVVAALDLGIGPADELAPAHPPALGVGLPVGEPGRREDRRAVEVEGVDLVVVEGGDDLQVAVVVDVADRDVLAVRAVAVVAHLVELQVVARPRELVVAGPGGGVAALGLEQVAVRAEDEDLGARGRGVGRRRHDLDACRRRRGPRRRARVLPGTGRRCSWTPANRASRAGVPPRNSYAATVPALPATTMSVTPSPSRSATTDGG